MRRGFTLIELLVVIAIISILAGILFPVFAKARAKGEQTACVSNVRQLVMAAMEYSSDHDWAYPYESRGHIVRNFLDPASEPNWARSLMPYVNAHELFQCPSAGFDPDYPFNPGDPVVGFAYNCELAGPEGGIQEPALKVLLWDTGTLASATQAYGWTDGNGFPMILDTWKPPHNEGRNFGFCDGHAKWLLDRYAYDQGQTLADGPYN